MDVKYTVTCLRVGIQWNSTCLLLGGEMHHGATASDLHPIHQENEQTIKNTNNNYHNDTERHFKYACASPFHDGAAGWGGQKGGGNKPFGKRIRVRPKNTTNSKNNKQYIS